MADIKIFNPDGMSKPKPYSHVAFAKTQGLVFIAGQTPIDANGTPVGRGNFEAQCEQVFANIHTALRSVDADWNNVVQFTATFCGPNTPTRTAPGAPRRIRRCFPMAPIRLTRC